MHINNADAGAAIHEVSATCTRPAHAALALAEPKVVCKAGASVWHRAPQAKYQSPCLQHALNPGGECACTGEAEQSEVEPGPGLPAPAAALERVHNGALAMPGGDAGGRQRGGVCRHLGCRAALPQGAARGAALPARCRTNSVSELPTACKPSTCLKTFRQTSGRKVVGWWRIGSCRPLVPCCALGCRGRFGMLRAASSQQPVGFDDRCCRMTCVAAGSCTGVPGGSDCVDGGRHERLRPIPARRGHCCRRATQTAGGHHFWASDACHHQCPHAPACTRLPEGGLPAGPEPRLHMARHRGSRKRSWRTAWTGCGSCSSRRSRLRVSLPCWRAPPHWDVRPLLPTEHPCWQPQKATGGEASCAAGAQATKQRGWRHWTWSTCSSRCGTTAASMHRRHAEHSPCTLFTRVMFTRVTPFQQTTCARTQRIVLRCPSMRPVAPVLLTSG